MRRILALLLLVVALCAMTIGPANAQIESPIGVPMTQAPGWWKFTLGGATAVVAGDTGAPGWGSKSLVMTTGENQAVASTDLLLVPGITKISSIVELSYWTFAQPTSQSSIVSAKAPTLQLAVDVDQDLLWDTHLVYEPAFNGEVVYSTWQQWNTLEGLWYSTRDIGIAPQNDPRTLGEIFAHDGGAYFEIAFSLLPADPGGDLRVQFGSSGGGYPGNVARADGIEFQLRNVPEIQTDFEGAVEYVVRLLNGLADGD